MLGSGRTLKFTNRVRKEAARKFKRIQRHKIRKTFYKKNLTIEEQLRRLKQKINSPTERFFKKSEIYQQKANLKTAEGQTIREKYKLIDRTLESPRNKLECQRLCDIAGVSKVEFYSWKKRKVP